MVGRGNANDLTNKEGRYDLTHLPEGEFTLVARADGYETTEVVSVKSGQRVPDLILGRFSSIKVVAEASDTGLPVLNYKIQLKKNLEDGEKRNPFDRRFEAKTIENEEGEYIQEGLGKGRYQLELVSRGYRHVSREVLLKGDEDYTEVIKMEPGFILEILAVRKDTMDPIEGVEVKYRMLQDDNSKSIEQPTLNVEYRTGQDGLAVLDSLSEGQYSISVTHPYYINETDLVNMEFPRDTDRQLKCEFSPAGIVKGKFNNISEENFQSVDYKLEFYTLDGKGKQKVPDESANPSEETWDYNLWVDPTRGTINQESMRVGNYKLLLKRKTYQIEEGQRVDSEPVHASFQMGELEIRPGETHDLNLMVPE